MEYPRLPIKLYKKKVLTQEDVEDLVSFYAEYKNIRLTARKFHVSRHTVKYHTDPEYKERKNKYTAELNNKKYHGDEERKKNVKKSAAKSLARRRKIVPNMKKWERQKAKNYRERKKREDIEGWKAKKKAENQKAYQKRKIKKILNPKKNSNIRQHYNRWQVYLNVNKQKLFKSFATRHEAEKWCADMRKIQIKKAEGMT